MSTSMNNLWSEEQARSGVVSSAKSLATTLTKEKLKNDSVPDDWEDDDEEEDDDTVAIEERNKRIWDKANSRESRPMPSVIMSRGLSNTSSNLPLNELPTMRILKRPSPSASIPTNINTTMGESLQDREARYLAARERIFGISKAEDELTEETKLDQSGKKPSLSSATIPSQVIRELRGPALGDGTNTNNKGFVNRRAKNTVPPPSKTPSEDTPL